MEYDFDGTVKVDSKLVLHSSDRIVIAAETERPNHTGYRSHVLVLDQREGLPMGDGLLGVYASYDATKLERMLDYKDTQTNRALKQRFVTYVRNTEGHSFEGIHQAIVSASRKEEEFIGKWKRHMASCAMMDDLESREFSSYPWRFVLD